MSSSIQADRALGALHGLAIGDALGMPTQEMERAAARRILGSPPGFRAGPPENPISAGLPAGTVTDDTLQCLLIARLLIEGGGRIEPIALADALLEWEAQMEERGLTDLLGPSTRAALRAVAAGQDPATSGRSGTTNGAAMRITPVGIATPVEPLHRLLEAVMAADRVTHDTQVAHAGAAAVAALVSAGVAGCSFAEAASRAVAAAAHFGYAAHFGQAFERFPSAEAAADRFGTGVGALESVVTAMAVAALSPDDAWTACVMAAGLGGDTDTIAALAGAMVGACTGLKALPPHAVRMVRKVNALDFGPLVNALLELRMQ